jgi:hypothetical protein
MTNQALYAAILSRSSTRRYRSEPLNPADHAYLQALVEQAAPALSPTLWNWRLIDEGVDQALLKSLGAYGRLLTPPHLLAAGIAPGPLALIELGFRLEQVAVGLRAGQGGQLGGV